MKQKVALVLSGGGARGIAHIGVIEELEKQGFEISSISGTSMGALVGGIYTLGKLQEYKNWLYTLDKMKIFTLVDFTLSSQGLIKGDKVFNKMKEFIPDTNIEDLRIPYVAVAADIIHKKEVTFTKGSIFSAIRASIAIPTVFTPVKLDGILLVDGGIINNVPLSQVKRTKGDIVVAVNVNADIPFDKPKKVKKETIGKESAYQKKIKEFYVQLRKKFPESHTTKDLGYFELMNKTINLMTNRIAQIAIENYPPDILIEVSHDACNTFDFFKAEELVELGRSAAIARIYEFQNKTEKIYEESINQ